MLFGVYGHRPLGHTWLSLPEVHYFCSWIHPSPAVLPHKLELEAALHEKGKVSGSLKSWASLKHEEIFQILGNPQPDPPRKFPGS